MFETAIIADALEIFLQFEDLKAICNVSKYTQKMFLQFLHKRTMWKRQNLPKDIRFVHRLKLEWDDFEVLVIFTNLKELHMIYTFWSAIDMSYFQNTFPNTLSSLHLGDNCSTKLSNLPPRLQRLTFGKNCKIQFETLPDTLEELTFGDFCKIQLEKCVFPQGLQIIEFGAGFSESLEPLLLLNVKEIRLNRYYTEDIPENLQDKVTFVCYEKILWEGFLF
jgi:hypothetical protein